MPEPIEQRPQGCGHPPITPPDTGCPYPGYVDRGPLFHTQEAEKPNGTYEGAGYHHPGSKGEKSPAPKDGQAPLDDSVEVEDSKQKVGIEGDKFVVLKPTNPHGPGEPIYHGYTTDCDSLHHALQKALKAAGLTNNKGKILK